MSEGRITTEGWSQKVHLQLLETVVIQISRASLEPGLQANWRGSLLRAVQVRSSQGHQLGKKKEAQDCVALCRLTKWSAQRKDSLSHVSSAAAAQQNWSCTAACSRCSCGGLRRVWVSCRLPLATCSSPDGALAQGAPALPRQPCLSARLARAAGRGNAARLLTPPASACSNLTQSSRSTATAASTAVRSSLRSA